MAVRREPGLLSTEVVLPLEALMPICVGMTWTWTVPEWELLLEELLASLKPEVLLSAILSGGLGGKFTKMFVDVL